MREVPAPKAPVDTALGDRWYELATALDRQGAISALTRELAWQAALLGVDSGGPQQRWRLQVESESLRATALSDKLAAALSLVVGAEVCLDIEAGVPQDTPARRDAQARAEQKAQAEQTIRNDPVVVELMKQFKSARIVPGSIQAITLQEGNRP